MASYKPQSQVRMNATLAAKPILCKCRSSPGISANLVLSLKSKTKHDCMLYAVYLPL